MTYTPRRLRPRRGIPYVVTISHPLTDDESAAILAKVRAASARGAPLVVGPGIGIVSLGARR